MVIIVGFMLRMSVGAGVRSTGRGGETSATLEWSARFYFQRVKDSPLQLGWEGATYMAMTVCYGRNGGSLFSGIMVGSRAE